MKDPNKRFGISLGTLSSGRIGLTYFSYCFMNMALTIAIRYAAQRKQFGPTTGEEIPIIEYQLHVFKKTGQIKKIDQHSHFFLISLIAISSFSCIGCLLWSKKFIIFNILGFSRILYWHDVK